MAKRIDTGIMLFGKGLTNTPARFFQMRHNYMIGDDIAEKGATETDGHGVTIGRDDVSGVVVSKHYDQSRAYLVIKP